MAIGRRQFISTLSAAAATWPLAARAQQPGMQRIGVLNGASQSEYGHLIAAFREALRENGYVESQNIEIEYRWADGQYDKLPALAADLTANGVSLIFATGASHQPSLRSRLPQQFPLFLLTVAIRSSSGLCPVSIGQLGTRPA
jgi:ABC-type uncharacterized transport system substrate-binding protein